MRLGLYCRCGKGGHFAKDCQAPALRQKILYLEQQWQATDKTESSPKNDEGAYTPKKVLALLAL
jgi:hypothetical protein